MVDEEISPETVRDVLVPLRRPVLPQRHHHICSEELGAATAVLRSMYSDTPKMLERIARAIPLAEHDIRFGLPESFGTDSAAGVIKKGFPKRPTRDDNYTLFDPDGYGVVIGGYPQASTFCACPDFWNTRQNPTGTCKHQIAAALMASAQAMSTVFPMGAGNASVARSVGTVLVDPLVVLTMLLLVTRAAEVTVTIQWTGSHLAVQTSQAQRAYATAIGEGSGCVVVPDTHISVLAANLATDWLAADECLLSFADERLTCVAETFTWECIPTTINH